jgi:hypothetical protein
VPTSVAFERALCVDLRRGEDSHLGLALWTAVADVPALRIDVAVVLALRMEEELLALRTDVGAVLALRMEEAVLLALRTDEALELALRMDGAGVLALETEPMRDDVMERASEDCE